MKALLSLILCLRLFTLEGKEDPRYPISDIPEDLRKGAYAVVREDAMVFTILSRSTATLHAHMVVTIFNDKGVHFAKQTVYYDKLRKITSLKAQILDANGKLIKRLKPGEITDHSAFEGLYDDTRVKAADLVHGQYPYTIEFEYDVAYRVLYDIDGTYINPYEDVSVQHASYQLVFPESLRPRYKTYNVTQKPLITTTGNNTSVAWAFENIKAKKFEPYSDFLQSVIRIDAAPTLFEFEGYAGNMESWDEFGRWVASLNKGRNILPEETKAKVREIASSFATREEKVKALYEYMQSKTRYVSIQLGIGGFQPFEASVVDKTGYGDCKALSNYMVSMLETIGIKGHYALIRAGSESPQMETDFPSSQFNHAIVAVPNGADTIWLECTSQTNPFGYQGTFTGDRKALLITENGAAIVKTSRYPAEVNLQSTLADVHVSLTGNATATFKRTHSGLQYENGNLNHYITREYTDQKKWLQNSISIPSFDIKSFSIQNVKNRIPSAVVTAELRLDRLANVSGKRLFIMPNLMNRNSIIPEKVENRQSPVIRRVAFIDVDTIRFHLPEEIYPEFLPENVRIESRFGEYDASFTVDQGNLMYIRKLRMKKGEFPASAYQELIDFYRSVNKADNIRMVFMSKT